MAHGVVQGRGPISVKGMTPSSSLIQTQSTVQMKAPCPPHPPETSYKGREWKYGKMLILSETRYLFIKYKHTSERLWVQTPAIMH